MADWQPQQYLKFRNERTQPTIDLVNRIGDVSPTRILDVGCGPGNSTAVLRAKWPGAELYGLDNSKNMLDKAKADYTDINWLHMNSGDDLSGLGTFDVVFSNAALQWMPAHEKLLPHLYTLLTDTGVLAVQVPYAKHLPLYTRIQELTGAPCWVSYFTAPPEYPKHFDYNHYYDIISTMTDKIEIWQTDYIHLMASHSDIVEWYKGSGLRPFLDMLPDDSLRDQFCSAYHDLIKQSYPIEKNGKVLLPFTRVFFTAYKNQC
jgi:trans-aconitate 2-methyltransferase